MLKNFGILAVSILILGCGSAISGDDSNPAIGGYSPVGYFKSGGAVVGSPEIAEAFAGRTYYFESDESRETFRQDPEKFLPAYDGWCAYGMTFGQKVNVDPTVFSIVDDKLYLNKNESIGETFDKDQPKYIAKANQKWKDLD